MKPQLEIMKSLLEDIHAEAEGMPYNMRIEGTPTSVYIRIGHTHIAMGWQADILSVTAAVFVQSRVYNTSCESASAENESALAYIRGVVLSLVDAEVDNYYYKTRK